MACKSHQLAVYPLIQKLMNYTSFQRLYTETECPAIMEYGSTPYVGMARKKMAALYNAYKIIRSELGSDYSHRLL